MATRILIVDDEPDICEILGYNLEEEGFEVETAQSAEQALGMDLASFSLVLLDVMMGEMSGFELASALKRGPGTSHIPIIFITALDGEDDTVRGLNLGADDYIAKPLGIREVKARVRAVLRRAGAPQEGVIRLGGLALDPDLKVATLHGERLALTRLEFEVLSLLAGHPGRLFSRESLLRRCWPEGTVVSDRTVDVGIARLRRKLGGEYGKYIKARIGYGYTLEMD